MGVNLSPRLNTNLKSERDTLWPLVTLRISGPWDPDSAIDVGVYKRRGFEGIEVFSL